MEALGITLAIVIGLMSANAFRFPAPRSVQRKECPDDKTGRYICEAIEQCRQLGLDQDSGAVHPGGGWESQ